MSNRKISKKTIVHDVDDPDLEIAKSLRLAVANKDKWCQGSYYVNGQRCMAGHLAVLIDKREPLWGPRWCERNHDQLDRIAYKLGFSNFADPPQNHTSPVSGLIIFNDTHKHEDVVARLDKGIANWNQMTGTLHRHPKDIGPQS